MGENEERVSGSAAPKRADLVETLSKALGALAGLLAVVYVIGGVQLTMRLAIDGVPWQPVISEAPRDLLVSTGASPLVIAVVVALGYVIINYLRKPTAALRARRSRFLRPLATWVFLTAPFAALWTYRSFFAVERGVRIVPAVITPVVMVAVTVVLLRARSKLARVVTSRGWNARAGTLAVAGLYGVAAVPAAMAGFNTVPPSDVKVCSTANFEERGSLVGRAGDRLIIAERGTNRRLTYLPTSQIEQVFVGRLADTASCDFDEARWAIIGYANAQEAQATADEVSAASERLDSGADPVESVSQIADLAGSSALRILRVADAAREMSRFEEESDINAAGYALLDLTREANETVRAARVKSGSRKNSSELTDLAHRLRDADASASRLAQDVSLRLVREAARRQPT